MLNDKIKGAVAGLLIGTTLTTGLAFAKNGIEAIQAEYSDIKIYMDGVLLSPKDANGKTVEPFIYDGTTYLPVRAVGEDIAVAQRAKRVSAKTISTKSAASTARKITYFLL